MSADDRDDEGDPMLIIITECFGPYLVDEFNLTAEFLSDLYQNNAIDDDVMLNTEKILKETSPVKSLLGHLTRLNRKGTYKAFIDCLRNEESGNQYHADYIEGLLPTAEIESKPIYQQLIQAFHKELRVMMPDDMISYMLCFGREERENIKQTSLNYGATRAAVLLLTIVFKKGTQGFSQLLEGLHGTGFRKLAEELANIVCTSSSVKEEMFTPSTFTGTIVDKPVCMDFDSDYMENLSVPPLEESSSEVGMGSANYTGTIRLYNFQKELLAPGLSGRNSVIVAPTGSGKTYIAARLAKAFLDGEPGVGQRTGNAPPVVKRNGSRKVVFLVNKVPLVEQQLGVLNKFIGAHSSAGVSGDSMKMVSISNLIKSNDVVVMTAQLLVNALKPTDPSHQAMDLSEIGLLILDECHHCQKGDPYNQIMSYYYDQRRSSPHKPRPQILAMTASMGIGKAKHEIEAQQYILQGCANLDAECLCTVQDPKNKEELQKMRATPEEELFVVPGRKDDAFTWEIIRIMEQIETLIAETQVGGIWLKHLRRPKHGTLTYENWLVSLEKFVAARSKDEDHEQKILMTCKDHLKVYNTSLYLNRDARMLDALTSIQQYINGLENVTTDFDSAERKIVNFFEDKLSKLLVIATSKLPERQNNLLETLSRVLIETIAAKPDSRGILFCKRRDTTKALVDWITDTPELTFLNPGRLIGGRGSEGMNTNVQETILAMFREGNHKLIVATSVAQEGLDIALCNVVIRYNYISNEVGRVQDRGRSRAQGGKFYQIISQDLGLESGVIKNRLREKIMHEATEKLQKMSDEDFLRRISEIQEKNRRDREISQRSQQAQERSKRRTADVRLLCRKCRSFACSLDDVRCIDNAHRIVFNNSSFLKRCRMVEHQRPIAKVDFQKLQKIFCKNEHCSQDWGVEMMYHGCLIYALKPTSFVFDCETAEKAGASPMFAKWKDVTYKILAMSISELQKVIAGQLHVENPKCEEEYTADGKDIYTPS